MAGKKKKFMELQPNWQSFFELAKQFVREEMPESGRQNTVLEMLEYGKRLDAAKTLGGDPYAGEIDYAASKQDEKFADLERKALEDIQKLADSDDPSITKLAAAAKDYVDKEGK